MLCDGFGRRVRTCGLARLVADDGGSPMTDPLIGQTFDRYQIVSPLGDGQFGAAYKAFDPTLQRDVAIKLIPLPEGRPDLPDAIMRQARLAARLDYPGLVKVHDFGRAGPWLY